MNTTLRQGTNKTYTEKQIDALSSESASERESAQIALLHISKVSPDSRNELIHVLSNRLAKTQDCADVLFNPVQFAEWKELTNLIGILKITEVLDILIEQMECTQAESLSLDAYPATKAVVAMGVEAVPKLSNALAKGRRVGVRFMAADALFYIGGKEARAALKRASKVEEPYVRRNINYLLSRWSDSGSDNRKT